MLKAIELSNNTTERGSLTLPIRFLVRRRGCCHFVRAAARLLTRSRCSASGFFSFCSPRAFEFVVSTAFPVSESMETAVEQREGYHEKWDKPKSETMRRFYEKYPNTKFPDSQDKFSWGGITRCSRWATKIRLTPPQRSAKSWNKETVSPHAPRGCAIGRRAASI
jgi:hypothetical protein